MSVRLHCSLLQARSARKTRHMAFIEAIDLIKTYSPKGALIALHDNLIHQRAPRGVVTPALWLTAAVHSGLPACHVVRNEFFEARVVAYPHRIELNCRTIDVHHRGECEQAVAIGVRAAPPITKLTFRVQVGLNGAGRGLSVFLIWRRSSGSRGGNQHSEKNCG